MAGILIVTDNGSLEANATQRFRACLRERSEISSCRFDEALQIIQKSNPLWVVLDLSGPADLILSFVEKNVAASPPIRLIGLGEPSEVSLAIKLARAGMKDFLGNPFLDKELMDIVGTEIPKDAEPKKSCKVISFYSPKGGSGVTLLTTNVGVALTRVNGASVALCDLSSQCGDIATYLNLAPIYTLRHIVENSNLLDQSFLQGTMVRHRSGVHVLSGPSESQEPLNQDHLHVLRAVHMLLSASYDYLLFDCGKAHAEILHDVISSSDLLFLIGNPDVVSLKGMISFYKKLRSLRFPVDKIRVVVNRQHSKGQIDVREFEKLTKRAIDVYVPNNFSLCIEAINTGKSVFEIQDKSDLARKISEIATIIMAPEHAAKNNQGSLK